MLLVSTLITYLTKAYEGAWGLKILGPLPHSLPIPRCADEPHWPPPLRA